MRDQSETKKQTLNELVELRQRVAELEVEVSEHKYAKAILQDYNKVIESSQDMIAVVDQYYKYLLVNARFLEYRGLDREQVVGKSVAEVLGKDVFEKDVKKKLDACFRGEVVRYEMKHIYPELGERGLLVSCFPIENPEGINRVVSVIRDITDLTQAEETLRESEKRYLSLFENMLDGYAYCRMLFDENDQPVDFEYLEVNSAFEKLTGLKNVVGRRVSEVIPNIRELHPELFEIYGRTALTGKPEKFEIYLESLKAWLSISVYSTQRGYFVTVFDIITERKQAEEAIKKSETKYRKLHESMMDGFVFVSMDGMIKEYNESYREMVGYTPEELLKLTYRDLTPEKWHTFEQKIVDQQILTRGYSEVYEKEYRKKDGTIFPVELRTFLIKDEASSNIGMWAIVRDITERKQAEAALRQSEEKFRELYDYAPVGYHEYDTEGRITSVNRTGLEMLGYRAEEMIGHFICKFSVEEEARQQILAMLAGTLPPSKNLERAYRRKDGTTVPVMIENQLVLDEKGGIRGIRSTVQDITERKRVEEDRKDLETRSQRMEKMEALGTLAGGVAHDLNNILSGLVGYPGLILMQLPDGSPLREPVLGIQRSGQKSAAIVEDLLTLARRGMVSMEPMNLNHVILDYMKTPEQEKTQSFHRDVRFELSLGSDLLPIKGSCVHLSKTVMNLLSNAAEAIPARGVVTISTRNQYLDQPIKGYDHVKEGDYVVLEVSDTGRGISTEDMGRIFEPFYTKKKMGRSGTGLGLAVVWGTVKDHNGYIDVRSEEGRGTTFTLYFPVTREALTQGQPPISLSDYMGKGETILVVDDVMEQRELAVAMLSKLHYKVTSVSSGEAAIEYMKTCQPDLLILDMIMDPGIDGLETYRRILELHPRQRAIIASGFSETERVRQALDLGAGAFLRKPYLLEQIALLVSQELDKGPL